MKKQINYKSIGLAIVCLGVCLVPIASVKANSLNTTQDKKTKNLLEKFETSPATRLLALNQTKSGNADPRGQRQEIVDEQIEALSPLKKRRLFQQHFPVILNQKPKTGIKRIFKNRNGIILKTIFTDGRVKYFDKKGNYLKQKNKDGSWQFKIGYSTEKDWHLGIIESNSISSN